MPKVVSKSFSAEWIQTGRLNPDGTEELTQLPARWKCEILTDGGDRVQLNVEAAEDACPSDASLLAKLAPNTTLGDRVVVTATGAWWQMVKNVHAEAVARGYPAEVLAVVQTKENEAWDALAAELAARWFA
jgi:hypothetical protein